jgi:hypothetical protein
MRQTANARIGAENLTRLRLGQCDKVSDTAQVRLRTDDQDDSAAGEERDRREVLAQIKSRIGIDDLTGDDGQGRQEECVAILGGAGDIFGSDAGARSGFVFNNDLLAKEVRRAIAKGARCDIGSRSWREADNKTDWTRRIGLLSNCCAIEEWQRDTLTAS